MQYPTLYEQSASRDMVDVFKGYNHNLRISDSEFYDMMNITSLSYPLLSPRERRGVYASPAKTKCLIAKDSLCYVDGTDFVMNDNRVDMGLSDEPKQLVSMGAYVIIFPDKKYINTTNIYDWGSLETEITTKGKVTFSMCNLDGTSPGAYTISDKEPTNVANGDKWLDTSTTPHVLKVYSASQAVWSAVATTYVKIAYPNIANGLNKYDGITISGLEPSQLEGLNNQTSILWDVHRDEDGEGTEDYIIVVGILDDVEEQEAELTIKRTVPDMDFVVESGNRLWGCKYGLAKDGKTVNEIYASKLGDFKNWNCFMGISTDSYAASVGTDGVFTGAITHLGYPLFFKENFLHKVYGNYPANYQVQTTACRGVQKGSAKSLAIVNEVLYYKSRLGVCAYDGSLPAEVSAALGEISYFDAVGGSHGNKYYISMADGTGVYHLFVYDTAKGMWHKEDNTQVDCFCSCRNEMYFIDSKDKTIKTVFGSGVQDTEPVQWMAQTGILGVDSPDKKYISRLNVRMALEIGTRVSFYIQYDSIGAWEHIHTLTGTSTRSLSMPIKPRRCDHLRLKIEGEGNAKIFSISKTIEQGSDM